MAQSKNSDAHRDAIVAAARVIYEANPMRAAVLSSAGIAISEEFDVPFDDLESSGTSVYEDAIATAEKAIAVYLLTLKSSG